MNKPLSLLYLIIASCTAFSQTVNAELMFSEMEMQINADESVSQESYTNEKIFLSPENLYLTENGIFLHLSGDKYVSIPCLYSDSNGCWVPYSQVDNVDILNKCRFCGQRYFYKCRNPECPSYNK